MTSSSNQHLETLFNNIEVYYQQEYQSYNAGVDSFLNQLNLAYKKRI